VCHAACFGVAYRGSSVYSASYTVYFSTVASRSVICLRVLLCLQLASPRISAELANLKTSYPNAGRGVRWKGRGGYSIYVVASSIANPFSPFELTVFPNRECASTSVVQVCPPVCLLVTLCVFTLAADHLQDSTHRKRGNHIRHSNER
jgi:hypothetical protein